MRRVDHTRRDVVLWNSKAVSKRNSRDSGTGFEASEVIRSYSRLMGWIATV